MTARNTKTWPRSSLRRRSVLIVGIALLFQFLDVGVELLTRRTLVHIRSLWEAPDEGIRPIHVTSQPEVLEDRDRLPDEGVAPRRASRSGMARAERLHAQAADRIDLALDQKGVWLLDVAQADELAAALARRAERELLRLDGRARSLERVRDRLGHGLAVDDALEPRTRLAALDDHEYRRRPEDLVPGRDVRDRPSFVTSTARKPAFAATAPARASSRAAPSTSEPGGGRRRRRRRCSASCCSSAVFSSGFGCGGAGAGAASVVVGAGGGGAVVVVGAVSTAPVSVAPVSRPTAAELVARRIGIDSGSAGPPMANAPKPAPRRPSTATGTSTRSRSCCRIPRSLSAVTMRA